MAEVTLIVAPLAISEVVGVAAIKISARYLYACDKELKTLFSCKRRAVDDVTQEFIPLLEMIAKRAADEVQSSINAVDKVSQAIAKKV